VRFAFPWFFPGEAGDLIVIWPKGSSCQGTLAGLGKRLMHIANRGAGGIPHVHLWAGLLPDQVACWLLGQATYTTVLNYVWWAIGRPYSQRASWLDSRSIPVRQRECWRIGPNIYTRENRDHFTGYIHTTKGLPVRHLDATDASNFLGSSKAYEKTLEISVFIRSSYCNFYLCWLLRIRLLTILVCPWTTVF
jgi:hypothetical protein